MTPANLEVGKQYPGTLPDHDAAVFEFSKEGPELRLFFSGIPDHVVQHVQDDDCYLGLLRSGDIAVVPWRIGEIMSGDAQFHVFLYPPETRPTPEILDKTLSYIVQIILVDRASRIVKVSRRVRLSPAMSKMLNEVIAYQHGNHIGREAYDAQVSVYQNQYANVADAIAAALIFENASPCMHAS
ncbi:MAG TPA: hypothetical protein VGE12_05710 [Noviherbaspirillum sp.]